MCTRLHTIGVLHSHLGVMWNQCSLSEQIWLMSEQKKSQKKWGLTAVHCRNLVANSIRCIKSECLDALRMVWMHTVFWQNPNNGGLFVVNPNNGETQSLGYCTSSCAMSVFCYTQGILLSGRFSILPVETCQYYMRASGADLSMPYDSFWCRLAKAVWWEVCLTGKRSCITCLTSCRLYPAASYARYISFVYFMYSTGSAAQRNQQAYVVLIYAANHPLYICWCGGTSGAQPF